MSMTIEQKVDQIMTLIQGNPLDKKDNGLAGKVNDIWEKDMKRERREKMFIGFALGLCIPAGAGLGQFLDFLMKFL